MRLERFKRSTGDTSRLVAVVPPPDAPLPAPGWATVRAPLSAHERAAREADFLELYRTMYDRLVDHAGRMLSEDEALDVVSDAMATLWDSWPSLDPAKRTEAYIFTCVHHAVWKRMKANQRMVSLEDAEEELDDRIVEEAGAEERLEVRVEVLEAALAAMPPLRREVFLLIREERRPYDEVAKTLGMSKGTVNTHYSRAMDGIRSAFARAGMPVARHRLYSGARAKAAPTPTLPLLPRLEGGAHE